MITAFKNQSTKTKTKDSTYKLRNIDNSLIAYGDFDERNPESIARELLAYSFRLKEGYDQKVNIEPIDENSYKVKTGDKVYILEATHY